jgi:tetratricopeptide (TPR) repeat protein
MNIERGEKTIFKNLWKQKNRDNESDVESKKNTRKVGCNQSDKMKFDKLLLEALSPRLGYGDKYQKALNKALGVCPQSEELWIYKAKKLEKFLRDIEAAKCFDKALEINPQNIDAWVSKGKCLHRANNNIGNAEIIKCYDKALEIAPGNAYVWLLKGKASERISEAESCYDKAEKISPQKAVDFWVALGAEVTDKNRLRCYERALEIDARYCLQHDVKPPNGLLSNEQRIKLANSISTIRQGWKPYEFGFKST